jgi:L-ribulose-5-phosphate 3-epimerase
MTKTRHAESRQPSLDRRRFLVTGAASVAGAGAIGVTRLAQASAVAQGPVITPPPGKRILLSCKLTMIPPTPENEPLATRLRRAAEAGFDGVDLDEAGKFTPEQARAAVEESGVFVHNAINHDHWKKTLTSPDETVRAAGRANIEHCLRVSHAAGGSGVLIVVGVAGDGAADVVEERCREEIKKLIPLAASLGQMILVETSGTACSTIMTRRRNRMPISSWHSSTASTAPGSACTTTLATTGSTANRANGSASSDGDASRWM